MTVPTNNKEREALAKLVIDMMPNVPLCCSGAAFKFEGHDQNPPCLTVIRGREIADVILAARRRNRSGDNTLPYISISETPVMYSPEAMHAYANGYNTALESAWRPREVEVTDAKMAELEALARDHYESAERSFDHVQILRDRIARVREWVGEHQEHEVYEADSIQPEECTDQCIWCPVVAILEETEFPVAGLGGGEHE